MNAFSHAKRRPRTARERAKDVACATCCGPIGTLHGLYRSLRRGYGYCSQQCEAAAKTARAKVQLERRVWSRIEKGSDSECWPFMGRRQNGYGLVDYGNRPILAHRLVYQLKNNVELTPDQVVCHACDNPPCCNPKHLWVGTSADNSRDMWRKGRGRTGGVRGESHGCAKLSESDVLEIRASSTSRADLAKRYGVTETQISNVISRKMWRHV